ncbi:hypothetical protein, partial [Escherichia coli]|uniref:hypothetical protein n=1 Tax=Escherichia coli TaxID=562 RepID=UPI001C5316F8
QASLTPLQASPAVIFARFRGFHVQQLLHVFCRPFTVNPRRNRDRMCKCNTVTRDDIPFAIWSGLRPDTPYQCVRAQCGFRFSSASSSIRSLRSVIDLRRAGSPLACCR